MVKESFQEMVLDSNTVYNKRVTIFLCRGEFMDARQDEGEGLHFLLPQAGETVRDGSHEGNHRQSANYAHANAVPPHECGQDGDVGEHQSRAQGCGHHAQTL